MKSIWRNAVNQTTTTTILNEPNNTTQKHLNRITMAEIILLDKSTDLRQLDFTLVERFEKSLINNDTPIVTVNKYISVIKRFDTYLTTNDKTFLDTSKEDVNGFLRSLNLNSPSTHNNYLTYIKQIYKWMQSERIMFDITTGIKRKKVKRTFKKKSLPSSALKELYLYFEKRVEVARENALKDKRVKIKTHLRNLAYVGVLISMGARAGKATLVRVGDVDEEVLENGNVCVISIEDKGREETTQRPLPPFVFEDIEAYKKATGNFNSENFLFRRHDLKLTENKPVTYNMMWRVITKAFISLGYKTSSVHKNVITPHSLRHSLAELIFEKYGADYLKAFYNHASIDTSMIYAGRNIEKKLKEHRPDIEGMLSI